MNGKFILLVIFIMVMALLHYTTYSANSLWHVFHYRLNYIPIIFGAFWYGVRGGLGLSLLCIMIYLPGIFMKVSSHDLANQYFELVLYLVIGWTMGGLVEGQRRQKEKLVSMEKLAAIGKMSAFISHEIKNPLQNIKNVLHLLAGKDDQKKEEMREILRLEVDRLERITNEFLLFAKIPQLNRQPIKLDAFLNELSLLLDPGNQGLVSVSNTVAREFSCDPMLLKIILINLVKNALEAGGDRIRLELSAPEPDRVGRQPGRTGRQRTLHILVADNGRGVDPDKKDKIFELFYSDKQFGTGLGLPIVRMAVDILNGRVELAPAGDGPGSRFTVTIPELS